MSEPQFSFKFTLQISASCRWKLFVSWCVLFQICLLFSGGFCDLSNLACFQWYNNLN